MRLTTNTLATGDSSARKRRAPRWVLPVMLAAGAVIFLFDRATGAAPVQHLYYLPIILAGAYYGHRGGLIAALVAIVLYHAANPVLVVSHHYEEADILLMCLMVTAGLVAAKLAADARRMRELAATDDLTGLHNLRSFEREFLRQIRASRHRQTPLAVLVLDLDRLKSLNDRYGHWAGAEAVRTVGHVVARHLPREGTACRYGGDEFVAVLPHCGEAEAMACAEELREAVHDTAPVLLGREWPAGTLSVSIGVACLSSLDLNASNGDQQLAKALFRAADAALYQAKADGRNRVSSTGLMVQA